jgi:endonuclease-3 related protein
MSVLIKIYQTLYSAFGTQNWWPGDAPFEIAIGAILTQNTNWGNVEKAINNLKKYKSLSAKAVYKMSEDKLAELIKPAGYYNIKARRLKSFINFLMNDYHGSMRKMKKEKTLPLREKLLSINGIGPETADSILLYALGEPVFVIDAYTKRVLSRHGIMDNTKSYDEFQKLFHDALEKDTQLFNEYHALLVRVGKTYCKSKNPLCRECPLNSYEYF